MLKHLQASRLYLILCLVIYALGVTGYVILDNRVAERDLYASLDRNLFLAANSLKFALAPDYHDRARTPDAISRAEELKNRRLFNQLVAETDFAFVYTLVAYENSFFFSAPTVTDEEAEAQDRWYFHPYEDAPQAFTEALETGEPRYVSYRDQWGSFRSIALPQETPAGNQYLACADFATDHIDGLLRERLTTSLLEVLYFLFLTLPFVIFFLAQNSELQRANERLRRQGKRLERLAAERLIAQDEAERASAEKSLFLANMSHEIRTPMNIITGMCHLALESATDEEQRGYLENIGSSGRLLLRIINDILDFSRIEAGQLELADTPFSLAETIEEVIRLNQLLAEAKGLDLQLEQSPGVPEMVKGDPGRLQQILMNLLGNALKFTEQGTVTLGLACRPGDDEQVELLFTVRDTGIGISREQQERLFKPFSQADDSHTRKYGGTGLGLAICKKLTMLMGGTIEVASEPGEGSTFTLTIPSQPVASSTPGTADHAPREIAQEKAAGCRILIVDDHALNRDLVTILLEQMGFVTVSAKDGGQAIALATTDSFDLILMDIQMPDLDGLAATRRLREMGVMTPIVAMTSHALSDDHQKSLAAGMNDHLTKPIDLDALRMTLCRWLPLFTDREEGGRQ